MTRSKCTHPVTFGHGPWPYRTKTGPPPIICTSTPSLEPGHPPATLAQFYPLTPGGQGRGTGLRERASETERVEANEGARMSTTWFPLRLPLPPLAPTDNPARQSHQSSPLQPCVPSPPPPPPFVWSGGIYHLGSASRVLECVYWTANGRGELRSRGRAWAWAWAWMLGTM